MGPGDLLRWSLGGLVLGLGQSRAKCPILSHLKQLIVSIPVFGGHLVFEDGCVDATLVTGVPYERGPLLKCV